jgi:hypothetical protein
MLQGLVLNILKRYLGAYVEGINPEQLRLAVWQGSLSCLVLFLPPKLNLFVPIYFR